MGRRLAQSGWLVAGNGRRYNLRGKHGHGERAGVVGQVWLVGEAQLQARVEEEGQVQSRGRNRKAGAMKVTMEEGSDEGWQERAGWTVVVVSAAGEKVKRAELSAKRAVVGAGARMLFYPTLLYNVVRNKLESEFRWWDEIDEYVLLGAVPFPGDVVRLKDVGVHAVVTMNEAYETLVPTSMYEAHGIDHMVIPTRDYMFAPSFGDIRRGVEFINDHVQRKQRTYVHCKAGRGRSTTVVLCYLVQYKGMTPMEAFQYVRGKRPRVLLASAQWRAVGEYSRRIRGLAAFAAVVGKGGQ